MKLYNEYNLEDFLLDERFRLWATGRDEQSAGLWAQIEKENPDKRLIMQQAGELLRTWDRHDNELSHDQLEEQVSRILTSTAPQTGKPRFVTMSRIGRWMTAACFIIVAVLGYKLMTGPSGTSEQFTYRDNVMRSQTPLIEVINQEQKSLEVALPDGSKVTLFTGAKISYAEQFNDKKREVFLSGEAFFDVHRDIQRPFFVYANGLATRVLGTSFTVKTTDQNVEVLVRSGRVSVVAMKDMNDQEARHTELLLTPNQQAIFSTRDHVISKSITAMPLELIKPGREENFVFVDQPIATVFARLEKVYGIPIVYDSTAVEKCSVRVELSNEPFFTKLDIICQTIGASYRVSDGQVVVSSEGCE